MVYMKIGKPQSNREMGIVATPIKHIRQSTLAEEKTVKSGKFFSNMAVPQLLLLAELIKLGPFDSDITLVCVSCKKITLALCSFNVLIDYL